MTLIKFCFAALAACSLLCSHASGDIVIASWDTFGAAVNDPVEVAADFADGSVSSRIFDDAAGDPLLRRTRTNQTGDNTFGNGVTANTTLPAAATTGQLQFYNVQTAGDTNSLFIEVVNNNADTLTFDELLFDFQVQVQTNGTITFNSFDVSFENQDTGSSTGSIGSATGLASGVTEYSFGAGGASLASGETGIFTIDLSGQSHLTSSGAIDNVAITGQFVAVPEPSSLALLGLGVFGFVARRRR